MTPYKSFPPTSFWRKSVAKPAPQDVDPVISAPFKINRDDKIVTAGSCFAQHIARHLKNSGYNYHVTEKPHPLFPDPVRDETYGVFSARYGNIYTSRQLLQLFLEAFGLWKPEEAPWTNAKGRYVDPFRPAIEPDGFASVEELQHDRDFHLERVCAAFEELDIFIFTLGLTECWVSKEDGAVFPVCPGAAGGTFDPDKYEFKNLTVDEIVADMTEFTRLLHEVNPNARIILTVSPVPLVATASGQHVLTATTLSKSILRVAAEQLAQQSDATVYFPSYEIITGAYSRGQYFGEDLRSVTEDGVAHVMRTFMRHYTDESDTTKEAKDERDISDVESVMAKVIDVMCEEELIDVDR